MVAISSLKKSITVLRDCPLLLVYVFGLSAAVSTVAAIPLLGPFLALLSLPAVLGALYELFVHAYQGTPPTVELAVTGAEAHYRSLFGAYAILGFSTLVLSLIFGFLLGAASMANGAPELTPMVLGFISVGAACFLVLFHVAQFFDVAVVVGGASAVGSVRQSVRMVLDAPLQTLEYTMLRLGAAGFLSAIGVGLWASVMWALGTQNTPILIALSLLFSSLIITGQSLIGALFYSYHVAFYCRLLEETEEGM